jgi:predicted MPP superfamily phosphohydrolase
MKLAWLTDIHLNFLDSDARRKFYEEIINTHCDAVLISGDIAEAPSLADLLHEMVNQIKKPIYFILGNHDYYRGTVDVVRKTIATLTKTHEQLFWLPVSGIQLLTNDIILLGQDGWSDGRLGDYQNSKVALNDSRMIIDLAQKKILGNSQLLEKMQQLADMDAVALQNDLARAVSQHPKRIIVLTHIPPFKGACFCNGKNSDKNWLPFFSSKATGDVLMQVANNNPSIDFLVLCGHTHSEGSYQPIANLAIKAGKAEYYHPVVQEIIMI